MLLHNDFIHHITTMSSTSRDLTPVVPKKNRALFLYLIALMSLVVLLAIMPVSLGSGLISPFPPDPSILPLGAASFLRMWTEPVMFWASVTGFPLLAGLLLRFTGIMYSSLAGLLLGLASYGMLQAQARGLYEGQILAFDLTVAPLLTGALVILSITAFSGIIQLGAQSTAARRLLSSSALALLLPTLYYASLYLSELAELDIDSILYGVFLLPLAVWLIKGCFTLKNYDLTLDSRDGEGESCTSKVSCIICHIIAMLSPIMLYSLQIYVLLNLFRAISTQLQPVNYALLMLAVMGGLLVLRIIGTIIVNRQRRFSVILALLTASFIPAKLADYLPLRRRPILFPCILVSFSMLLWFALMQYARHISFFFLF